MDNRKNPYSPGAGTVPQVIAGRSKLIEKVDIELDRSRNGYSYRGQILTGLRGVGKTVLLNKILNEAMDNGYWATIIEISESRSLPSMLLAPLKDTLISHNASKKLLGKLAEFAKAMKIKYQDIEFSLSGIENEQGADAGDLQNDLTTLLVEIGKMAKKQKTAFVFFMDEIQFLKKDQLEALIMALHRCNQKQLPVILIGAGLLKTIGQVGHAKTYAERLFEYPELGPLNKEDTIEAIAKPASKNKVRFSLDALDKIFAETKGHPYFIQEWGKHCWKVAQKSPITIKDVKKATALVINGLDNNFFQVRYSKCTSLEKKYLRAMAELEIGTQKTGDIAGLMGKSSQQMAPIRAKLIDKGIIYSPSYGNNSFTVPLFGEFMKRSIPRCPTP